MPDSEEADFMEAKASIDAVCGPDTFLPLAATTKVCCSIRIYLFF